MIFGNFCNFFQNSVTPRDPWGGLRGLGGAPPRGYPTWVPPSNNLNILRFWNILEKLFRPNKLGKPSLGNIAQISFYSVCYDPIDGNNKGCSYIWILHYFARHQFLFNCTLVPKFCWTGWIANNKYEFCQKKWICH